MVKTNTWDIQIYGEGAVICWRCNGTTPESQEFPAGTICGQGDASGWPYTSQPNCDGIRCINPSGNEGDITCINGFKYTCTGGGWIKKIPEEPCGEEECAQYQTQSTCETGGCYWYAYPNPFGEPACFGKPIYIQYLPLIAVGIGALVVVAALLGRKKTQPYYPPMYYPPPPYYPPGGR